jgi:transposase
MQGTWRGDEDEFIVYGSLRSMIKEDHPLRRLDAVLDTSWVAEAVAQCYSPRCPKPSFAPETMLRLVLARFVLGIGSNRALCRWAETDLGLRWFCGLGVGGPTPEHSTLSKTLARWGEVLFGALFERVVQQAVAGGLVEGRCFHGDATLLRADVSTSTMSAEFGALVWAEVERERGGEGAGEAPTEPVVETKAEAPATPKTVGKGASKLARAAVRRAARAAAQAQRQVLPPAPPEGWSEAAFPPRKRARDRGPGTRKRSKTDPEASLARRSKRERCVPSYKQHTLVDDAHRIIVDVAVTTGEQHEGQCLVAAVARAAARCGRQPELVTADAGYGAAEVLDALAEQGIAAALKMQAPARGGRCAASQFKYDQRYDQVICPRGRRLTRRGRKDHGTVYRAQAADCRGCPLRAMCLSPQASSRSVWLPDGYVALVRARRAKRQGWSEAWREAYARHRWQVEGVQGEAKNGHGLARCAWRGLRKVRWQVLLTATILNLKRIAEAAAGQKAAQEALGRAVGARRGAGARRGRAARPWRPRVGAAAARAA